MKPDPDTARAVKTCEASAPQHPPVETPALLLEAHMEAAGRRMAAYLRHLRTLPERSRHELALNALTKLAEDPGENPLQAGAKGMSILHGLLAGKTLPVAAVPAPPLLRSSAHETRGNGPPAMGAGLSARFAASMERIGRLLQLLAPGHPALRADPGRPAPPRPSAAMTGARLLPRAGCSACRKTPDHTIRFPEEREARRARSRVHQDASENSHRTQHENGPVPL